jgi:hypothetical protein
LQSEQLLPSVFGRNLQCQPVRGVNFRDECHWSHACSLQASRRGIQSNSILECKFLPKKAHRAPIIPSLKLNIARGPLNTTLPCSGAVWGFGRINISIRVVAYMVEHDVSLQRCSVVAESMVGWRNPWLGGGIHGRVAEFIVSTPMTQLGSG